MNVNLYVIDDYENETTLRPQKNKPKTKPVLSAVEWANFFKVQNELKIVCQKIWPHPHNLDCGIFLDGKVDNLV